MDQEVVDNLAIGELVIKSYNPNQSTGKGEQLNLLSEENKFVEKPRTAALCA